MDKQTEFKYIRDYLERKDEQAATKIVRLYQNFVFATALRYLNDPEDSDDAAQEVFIKAFKNLKRFKFDSSLKTWLYRITVNHCINLLRKKKLKQFISIGEDSEVNRDNLASGGQDPERILENKEFEERFIKLLAKLPEKQRETFALRYFDELPYEEISVMLGTSVGGLKANYFQAVKKLSKIIKNNNMQV